MAHAIAEVGTESAVESSRAGLALQRSSRAAIWGTLASVASFLGSAILGVAKPIFILGGIGAVIGGAGMIVAGALVLRRSDARLPWRVAGALGTPLGASLIVYGLFTLLWRPASAAAVFGPPLLLRLAMFGLFVLGPIFVILVGLDVARFLIRGVVGEGKTEDAGDHSVA